MFSKESINYENNKQKCYSHHQSESEAGNHQMFDLNLTLGHQQKDELMNVV